MKRKFFLFNIILAALFLTACDPMEGIIDELDVTNAPNDDLVSYAKANGLVESVSEYVLVDADYAKSSKTSVKNNKNFSATVPAKDSLPEILNKKFFSINNGTEMKVGYNFYTPSVTTKSEPVVTYTLTTSDDTTLMGQKNEYMSKTNMTSFLPSFCADKSRYNTSLNFATILYTENGSVRRCGHWSFDGTTWSQVEEIAIGSTVVAPSTLVVLAKADYDSFGGKVASFGNFSSTDLPSTLLPAYLAEKYKTATSGTEVWLEYLYYGTSPSLITATKASGTWLLNTTRTLVWNFKTAKWEDTTKIPSSTVTNYSLFKFNKTDRVWTYVPPLKLEITTETTDAIPYTLIKEDYVLAGESYENFDLRTGKPNETEAARIAAITKILKGKKNLIAGQIYNVTFLGYNGSTATYTLLLKVVEDLAK